MAIKSVSIRIDDKLLDKLHYVADYEGRSANSHILVLVRDSINQFEGGRPTGSARASRKS